MNPINQFTTRALQDAARTLGESVTLSGDPTPLTAILGDLLASSDFEDLSGHRTARTLTATIPTANLTRPPTINQILTRLSDRTRWTITGVEQPSPASYELTLNAAEPTPQPRA